MAVDLALRGVRSVVLDDNNVVSLGSRAICWAKRTLEIFDRLGIGERMLEKGVTWKVGRQFHGEQEVYNFDLLPEPGHKYPAFVNLQQYYVEEYLIERAQEFPDLIDLRFLNKVTDHKGHADHVKLTVETPDGPYRLETDWYIACDGAGSATRKRMNLPFEGQTFDEHFLIADVEMETSPSATMTRPSGGSGSPHPFTTANPPCCTNSPTTSTASTCNWGQRPTQRPKRPKRRSSPSQTDAGRRAVPAGLDERL